MQSFTKAEYEAKVEAIFRRFPSVQKVDFGKAYKPGLETMEKFASSLGNPHRSFRSIHIAGTNGKGSVANILASVLQAAGLRTGLYTSPHILDFRERMRINGEMVSRDYVWSFLNANDALMDELGLSFFELTTGMAFRWFADSKVDVAVIETGLGGRLDSTNIIVPDLSVITSIALDHCSLLGNSLEEIAAEKAGIFKRNVPALVGEDLPRTRPVFESKASGFCPLSFALDSEPFLWDRKDKILKAMDLQGPCQRKNLRTALAAVDILSKMNEYAAVRNPAILEPAIESTAARMHFPARWEKLAEEPLIIADMGHNPAALELNFRELERQCAGEGRALIILFAIMADKDLDGILPLMPLDAEYVFTAPTTARALPAAELHQRFTDFATSKGRGGVDALAEDSVGEALKKVLSLAEGRKSLIYVGGSAYLVSEAEQMLRSGELDNYDR